MSAPKACPLCREIHEPRGLSFDGFGINGCGMYRSRIATFPRTMTDDERAVYGPMFRAAPELVHALRLAIADMESACGFDAYGHGLTDEANPWHESYMAAMAALAKAGP